MDPLSLALLTVGLVLVAGLAATWLFRPTLARMGIGYALHRRKQAALITAGLMIATTVIAAAGIAADSSGRSFTESLLGRLELTDVILDASFRSTAMSEEEVTRYATDPRLPAPNGVAMTLRAELAFEDIDSGRGDVAVPVWGIDPASFGQVGKLAAVAGNVPPSMASWRAQDIVANEAAARSYGMLVGDHARIYSVGQEVTALVNETFAGRLVLATWSEPPAGVAGASGVHHPDNVYQFRYNATRTASVTPLQFRLDSAADAEFVLTVSAAGGPAQRVGPMQAPIELSIPYEDSRHSQWDLRVDSPLAQNAEFTVTAGEWRRVVLPDKELAVRVVGIVEQSGSDPLRNGPVVFVARPTLQGFLEQPGAINLALIDYPADADLAALGSTLEEVRGDIWGGGVRVRNDRAELERERVQIEDAVRFTFLGIGSFSILAGFMLIGVMMALLVEERKRILATSRAIGAQRAGLTVAHAHEGSVYAAAAGIAGLLGAFLVAAGLAGPLQRIFQEDGGRFVLILKPATAIASVGAGFVLTMLAIIVSAHSASRFHIAAALKGEEQETRSGRRVGMAVAVVLGVVGALLSVGQSPWAGILGPCLLAIGAAALSARLVGRNLAYAVAALGLTLFLVASFWWVDVSDDNGEFLLYPLRGVLLSISLGVFAAYSTWLHGAIIWLANRFGRAGAYMEAAMGHLRRRPGRAALTISMFATVLVVLTALGTLFATFEPNDLGDTGGFGVLADSPMPLGDPVAYLTEHPPASGADPFALTTRWVTTPWVDSGASGLQVAQATEDGTRYRGVYAPAAGPEADSAIALTPEFVQATSFRAAGLRSDLGNVAEAFGAVMRDPRLVVLSDQLQTWDFDTGDDVAIRVGDTFQVGFGDDPVTVTVIGKVRDSRGAGAFVHPEVLDRIAQQRGFDAPGTRIWAEPARGVDDLELVAAFESAFRRAGLVAVAADNVDPDAAAVGGAFQTMISLFMGLGIVVGMVSLALIMGRNVLIRRAEIGTLRALGATPQGIMGMFSVEALYVSLTSIGIGFGVGLLLAWATVRTDAIFVPLRIDWGALLLLYGVTLVAALVAAFVPAWQASRVPPAQAVRYSE